MRVVDARIGTKVLFKPTKGRPLASGPLKQIGIIVGIECVITPSFCIKMRYWLHIRTAERGVTRYRSDRVKFLALPKVNPRFRRTIWIREDLVNVCIGVTKEHESPPFSWWEPSGNHNYRPFDIHTSHVYGLRLRERLLGNSKQDKGLAWEDFYKRLKFLKEEGAKPVDMDVMTYTNNML